MVQDEYEKSKRTADGLKMIYEEKMTQNEDDNTGEVREIKKTHRAEIEQLTDVINTIKDDIETIRRQKTREADDIQEISKQMKRAQMKKQYREEQMRDRQEEI